MTHEERESADAWVSLKTYVDARFAAEEKAKDLWRETVNSRLEVANGIRAQFNDHFSKTVPRGEWSLAHDRLVDDIRQLREDKARLEGKASQTSFLVVLVISLLGLALAAASLVLRLK